MWDCCLYCYSKKIFGVVCCLTVASRYSMVAGEFPFDDIQATLDGEYIWPVRPSAQLEKMIQEIFQLNPDLRITLAQLRRQEWVNLGRRRPKTRTHQKRQF